MCIFICRQISNQMKITYTCTCTIRIKICWYGKFKAHFSSKYLFLKAANVIKIHSTLRVKIFCCRSSGNQTITFRWLFFINKIFFLLCSWILHKRFKLRMKKSTHWQYGWIRLNVNCQASEGIPANTIHSPNDCVMLHHHWVNVSCLLGYFLHFKLFYRCRIENLLISLKYTICHFMC